MNITNYYHDPILGVYYAPKADWGTAQIARDLLTFASCGIRTVWLLFDPFYDREDAAGLRALMDAAAEARLGVVPVLGQFLQLSEHPEVKIVNADGSTSDDPRYWNMGCFRHPTVRELATRRALRFFREFGDHPALYRLDGRPVLSVVHEAYYRNSVPEFGGGPMHPNCYCSYCRQAFGDYLGRHGLERDLPPPKDPADPVLWQHWIDCHAEAIPDFLTSVIAAVKAETPIWATHECNDFYPASWQSVYTGNDWWRMGAVLDFGHEDMYPLEFDTRYQCYVYDYAKDILRSATGFNKLVTCNGQAFNSWLGYRLPENSMSEQIYSALAHGALGLVWWTQLHRLGVHAEPVPELTSSDDARYWMIRQTARYNREYLALVEHLAGFRLAQAQIALLYSWTTMSQALNDEHTYDTLLMYMLLVQSGYPVDLLSEAQVAGGVLQERGYRAVFVMGCGALPEHVQRALDAFVQAGGLLITDYAPPITDAFPPLYAEWRGRQSAQPRVYTLPDGTPVPVQIAGCGLHLPKEAAVLARFNDGSPAIARIVRGDGVIILAGSYLGWDYSNYPGYYDLGAMFPFLLRRDAALRVFVNDLLTGVGIAPPARSTNPDVEVAVWHDSVQDAYTLIVVNHLQQVVFTEVMLAVRSSDWLARRLIVDLPVQTVWRDGMLVVGVQLSPLEGCAFSIRHVADLSSM